MPKSPSVVVRVLGDVKHVVGKFGETGAAADTSAARITGAYRGVFGELNKTGVLGPFGDSIQGVDEALSRTNQSAKTAGGVMMGVGAAVSVAGRILTDVGSKEKASQQQLQAAVEATGQSYDTYKDQMDKAGKSQETYGHTTRDTNAALTKLTQATNDPRKALELLTTTSDLAASKHISLEAAAGKLGKAYNGNTRILKEYGIHVTKTADDHKVLEHATSDAEKADKSLADARKKLTDIQETYAGKTTLTVAEQHKLRDAQDAVSGASLKAYAAHVNVTKAQDNLKASTKGNHQAIDELSAKLKGQASAASDTFSGKLKHVQTTVEDTAAKIGEKYGPALQGIGIAMTAAGAATEIFASLTKGATAATEAGTVATKTAESGSKLAAIAQWLWNAAISAFPVILIIVGIAAIVAGFILLYKHSQLVRAIVADVGKVFTTVFTDVVHAVEVAVGFVVDHWQIMTAALLVILGPIGIVIGAFLLFHNQIIGFVGGVVSTVAGLPGKILGAVAGFGGLLVGAGAALMSGLASGISGAVGAVTGAVTGIPSAIVGALGNVGNILYGAGKSIIEGLGKGIEDALTGVLGKVGGIAGKIASLKGPRDVDYRLLQPAGQTIMAGLSAGLQAGFAGTVSTTLRNITAAIGGANVPGLSTSSGATSPGATIGGGRTGAAVVIEHATFATELDVEAFMKRAAWVAQTSGV